MWKTIKINTTPEVNYKLLGRIHTKKNNLLECGGSYFKSINKKNLIIPKDSHVPNWTLFAFDNSSLLNELTLKLSNNNYTSVPKLNLSLFDTKNNKIRLTFNYKTVEPELYTGIILSVNQKQLNAISKTCQTNIWYVNDYNVKFNTRTKSGVLSLSGNLEINAISYEQFITNCEISYQKTC